MEDSSNKPKLKAKQRHTVVTLWLSLILVYSIGFIIMYLTGFGAIVEPNGSSEGIVPILILLLILQIICTLALFRLKKWGVWGYCAINVIGLLIDCVIHMNISWPVISVVAGIVFFSEYHTWVTKTKLGLN